MSDTNTIMEPNDWWTARHMQAVTGGVLSRFRVPRNQEKSTGSTTSHPTGLSIDSRTTTPGSVFLALKGDQFDGHDFLTNAVKAGAPMLIVERFDEGVFHGEPSDSTDAAIDVLLVPDTIQALADLAADYRRRVLTQATIIAITGTNGKTTTKRIVHTILSESGLQGSASPKNFNNEIGVPLTLLSAKATDQYVVVEIGSSALGEVANLSALVQPDIAVITSIGMGHLEGLTSRQGVAEEKASILGSLKENGRAFVISDHDELHTHIKPFADRTTLYGQSKSATKRITTITETLDGVRFTLDGDSREWLVGLCGQHAALNATAALLVSRHMGIHDEQIAQALAKVKAVEGRLQPMQIGSIRVLNDSYNANPESMNAALNSFTQMNRMERSGGRSIAILADMLELGESANEAHQQLGETLVHLFETTTAADLSEAILIGPFISHAYEVLSESSHVDRAQYFPKADDQTMGLVADRIQPHDRILLKGSRGTALERILERLSTTL